MTLPQHPQPRPRASGTSGRSRSGPTRCASSPASSRRSGSARSAGSPAAASRGQVSDLALWMVPFGLVGGRLYHVITDWQLYFGEGQRADHRALRLAAAAWASGARSRSARSGLSSVPGGWGSSSLRSPTRSHRRSLIAQAIGRFGNYFNQELFGRPTDLPWGLEIDPVHRPTGYLAETTFHPTFLYESLWCLGAVAVIIWVDQRFRLGHGRVFALYVMLYTLGRGWIEMPAHRRRPAQRRPRPAAQRVDLDPAVRRRGDLLRRRPRAAPRPGDRGLPRRLGSRRPDRPGRRPPTRRDRAATGR